MFLTRKINKNTVVVMDSDAISMAIRPSGKAHYGSEMKVCQIKDGRLIIDKSVAEKFGLSVENAG